MSLDQLGYFVAVAEEGNIGRAARRLHISQPPLSRQIRSLEEELGLPLFRRTTRGVQLLPAGHRLLPRARDVLDAVARVRQIADDSEKTLLTHATQQAFVPAGWAVGVDGVDGRRGATRDVTPLSHRRSRV